MGLQCLRCRGISFGRKFCKPQGREKEMRFSRKNQGNCLISKEFSGHSLSKELPLGVQAKFPFLFDALLIFLQLSKLQLKLVWGVSTRAHAWQSQIVTSSHLYYENAKNHMLLLLSQYLPQGRQSLGWSKSGTYLQGVRECCPQMKNLDGFATLRNP